MKEAWARPGTAPTRRELVVALMVLSAPSISVAASRLGIDERSVRGHLANLRLRLRAKHNEELFFRLRDHLAA